MDNGKRVKYENILRHLEEAMYNMKSEEALMEEVEELDFMLEIVNVELQKEAHKEQPALNESWMNREGTRFKIIGCTETGFGKTVIFYKAEKEDYDAKKYGFKLDPLLSMPLNEFLGCVPGNPGETPKWRFEIDV